MMVVMLIWPSLITAKRILNNCHVGAPNNFSQKWSYPFSKDTFQNHARIQCKNREKIVQRNNPVQNETNVK